MLQKILLIIIFLFTVSKIQSQNLILKIHGKTEIETGIIDSISYKKNHTNFKSIYNELDSLSHQLNKTGYIEHIINNTERNNDSIIETHIDLHKKFDYIYIRYNANNLNDQLLNTKNIRLNKNTIVIKFNEAETTLKYINTELTKQGLPFSYLKLENIKIENDSVKAELKTSKKETPRHIDKIIIKGYEKFPKKFIKYYAKLKKGYLFNMEDIIEKTNTINTLTFANLIRDTEVLFTKESTTLYIYVEKQKSNNFDGYIGFSTNEDTNKLEFSGYLDMMLKNNLNYGEVIKLTYKSDESEQKTFNINIDAPYLFNSPIGTNAELNIFKKDSTFSTVDQSLKLYYQINTAHKVYLGISTTQSNNLLETTTSSSVEDYESTFYQTQYNYINTTNNNNLFPIKSYIDTELGLGSRTNNNKKENQIQFNTEMYHIFNLNLSNSIFTRLTSGYLKSDTYLENELLYFGGINSIRGFDENSITANLFGVVNLEYRYQLNSTMYINTITDFSYFENNISNQKEKMIGIGFGLTLQTKAGLLKLQYANGKTENQTIDINDSKIHISITTLF